ncbi:MAG: trehalose-6-phosphate synthase [Phycisphaerales bacterium]
MPTRSLLTIAANRLPVSRTGRGRSATWTRSPGGLVSAMEPILTRGGTWVGWDGGAGPAPRPSLVNGVRMHAVGLTSSLIDNFYHGFCNSTLWPLYHDAIHSPEFHRAWWKPYEEVNRRFAAAVARVTRRNGFVWAHDYHLQLLPRILREKRPDLNIGFFLHTPFPPEELFAWLPWRSAILRAMLACDVIAFQTESSARNFITVCKRFAGAEGADRTLTSQGRESRVLAVPIAIDTPDFERLAADPAVTERAQEIRTQLGGRKLLLAVDRLDYTKGVPQRLQAFSELLRSRRLSVDDAVLVQVAVPSREQAPGYREIRREVEEMVGRINGDFSEPGKVAVHYFRRSLDRAELVAYYLAAHAMLVTPLRDGMNLVAKEFVASRLDNTGVLVLSEFAGAARELRRALLVNPRDIDTLANTIHTAVHMPEPEQRIRMAILRSQVKRHDVFEWSHKFLHELGWRDD